MSGLCFALELNAFCGRAAIAATALALSACGGGASSITPVATVSGSGAIHVEVVQNQPPASTIEFPLSTAAAQPSSIALGGDSNYWVTESAAGKIARVTNAGVVTEFPFTLSRAPSLVTRGGGATAKYAVWSVDSTDAVVAQITKTGIIKETPLISGAEPSGIIVDSLGNGWIAATGIDDIVKITTASALTYYPLPGGAAPGSILIGPDKNVWVTEPGVGELASLNPSTGAVTQYPLLSNRAPTQLSKAGSSYLYFGESTTTPGIAYLARATTTGSITEYATPNGVVPQYVIGSGPLSATWFSTMGGQLEYYNANASPNKRAFTIATVLPAALPIVAGGDGNIWYPDPVNNAVGVYVVNPIVATSSSVSFTAITQTQSFSVSESNHPGGFYATSSNPSIASVVLATGNTFTITAASAGTATITVSDNSTYPKSGNAVTISVVVTTTSIGVN